MGAPTPMTHHIRLKAIALSIVLCLAVALSACTPPPTAPADAGGAASPVPAGGGQRIPGLPPGMRVEFVTPTPDFSAPPMESIKLVIQQPSQARYRASEMLLGRTYMSEAIGTTTAVSGQVFVLPTGNIVPGGSEIKVNLSELRSDEERRDAYIKANTLETSRFPEATFVPTSAEGIPPRPPESGFVRFRLQGNLTIKGITQVATWQVEADVTEDSVVGTATTQIRFADFGMEPPRVPLIASIDDTLRLDVNFTAKREAPPEG